MSLASTSSDIEPRLPPELERRIFELAALSHKHVIPPLLQVARRTLIWIDPLLYRVIVWDDLHDTEEKARESFAALRALRSKTAHFVHTAVQHVIIYFHGGSDHSTVDMDELLQRCTGGISFVCAGAYVTPRLLPILERIQVRRLSIHLQGLFEGHTVDLHHPLFSSVTHLYPFDSVGSPNDKDPFYLQLSLLPALTHLHVNVDFPYDAFSAVLAAFTRASWFCTCIMSGQAGSVALWVIDFWTRAEEFIVRKARGEIEAKLSLSKLEEEVELGGVRYTTTTSTVQFLYGVVRFGDRRE
ncbi:hypothetical protein C8J57DRAFT_1213895 [Mycena rebaudengoi]|nr:hypothetical protein C8J57DRAFT_1213895 [Mycena rebaudengoi]